MLNGNENLLVMDGNTGDHVWKGGRTFGSDVSQPVLSLAVVLSLSIIIRLEYIPQVVGWGIGLLIVLILPVIIVTGLLLLVYGVWQKRKMKRSDTN